MSSPPNTMRPASGRSMPESCAMKVVLPAPFGPMTACVSPSATSKSMPSLARSAPKLLHSFSTVRRLFMTEENACQAALEEDHRQHQQRPEHDLPVPRPALEDLLLDDQRDGAVERAGGGADAAE